MAYNSVTSIKDNADFSNTLVEQFTILFKNDDGTILDIQYVDKGSTPIDPITRDENPISTPKKVSSQQYD